MPYTTQYRMMEKPPQSLLQGLATSSDLCKKCEAIRFNDAGGYEGQSHSGKPILKFEKHDGGVEFQVDYKWRDTLPDLPALAVSADTGCRFCGFLRAAIQRCNLNNAPFVQIRLHYNWRNYQNPDGVSLPTLVATLHTYKNDDFSASLRDDYLTFPIYSAIGEQPATWLQLESSPMAQALCGENVTFMNTAINRCVQGCHPLNETSFLPTRLVDLGSDPSIVHPRLIVTRDMIYPLSNQSEPIKYVALSYCWGTPSESALQLKTEISSLDNRLAGIPLHLMSTVMKDTIRLMRALSLRYLWIDSLCIVQDDQEDWSRESTNMGLIYRHAYITLCLLGSKSCHEGFIDRAIPAINIEFQSSIAPSIRGEYTICDPGIFPDSTPVGFGSLALDILSYPWCKRGWTFQEYYLSTRLLLFGKSKIHFMCDHKAITENGSEGAAYDSLFSQLLTAQEAGKATPEEMYNWWRTCSPFYAERNLSHPKDKLPAISGVASYIAKATGDTYLAGLWKEDLTLGLLWSPDVTSPSNLETHLLALNSPDPYIAPSWSWASQNLYFEYGQSGYCNFNDHALQPEYDSIHPYIILESSNPFGCIQEGILDVSGRIITLPLPLIAVPDTNFSGEIWETRVQNIHVAYCELDWIEEGTKLHPQGEMLMLVIASACELDDERIANAQTECDYGQPGGHDHRAWGLILHPAEKDGQYYRVGIFSSHVSEAGGMKLFAECKSQIIRII